MVTSLETESMRAFCACIVLQCKYKGLRHCKQWEISPNDAIIRAAAMQGLGARIKKCSPCIVCAKKLPGLRTLARSALYGRLTVAKPIQVAIPIGQHWKPVRSVRGRQQLRPDPLSAKQLSVEADKMENHRGVPPTPVSCEHYNVFGALSQQRPKHAYPTIARRLVNCPV